MSPRSPPAAQFHPNIISNRGHSVITMSDGVCERFDGTSIHNRGFQEGRQVKEGVCLKTTHTHIQTLRHLLQTQTSHSSGIKEGQRRHYCRWSQAKEPTLTAAPAARVALRTRLKRIAMLMRVKSVRHILVKSTDFIYCWIPTGPLRCFGH